MNHACEAPDGGLRESLLVHPERASGLSLDGYSEGSGSVDIESGGDVESECRRRMSIQVLDRRSEPTFGRSTEPGAEEGVYTKRRLGGRG